MYFLLSQVIPVSCIPKTDRFWIWSDLLAVREWIICKRWIFYLFFHLENCTKILVHYNVCFGVCLWPSSCQKPFHRAQLKKLKLLVGVEVKWTVRLPVSCSVC